MSELKTKFGSCHELDAFPCIHSWNCQLNNQDSTILVISILVKKHLRLGLQNIFSYNLPWAKIKIGAYDAFVTKTLNLSMTWRTYYSYIFLRWTCAEVRACHRNWWCWNTILVLLTTNIDMYTNMWFLNETKVWNRLGLLM